MERVTLKEIADKAGVSIGTVDRALNNRGRILPETKSHIIEIANSLGYQPNRLASALRRKTHYRIAVIMSRFPVYFTDELLKGFEIAAKELQDFNIELEFFFSDSLSAYEQEPILNKLAYSEYDAIALNAGGESLSARVDEIISNGTPVVTFNSDIPGSNRLFYVGENPYRNGRVAGELMGKILGGKGTVAILAGFSLVTSHSARAAGFRDYLTEHYPDIRILDMQEYHDHEDEAYKAMQTLWEKDVAVQGVFCVSAVGVIGVGNFLKQHLSSSHICLIGYDINNQSAQLLKENYCAALIYQEPRKQSYKVLHLLYDLLSSNKPEMKEYYTKGGIVVSENLQDYMESDP